MEILEDGSVRSKSSAPGIEKDMDMHFWENVWFHLPAVQCPVLFLRPAVGLMGDSGHVYTDAEASDLTSRIQNCRSIKVDGGNHYTFLIQDHPPVLPHIEKFLEDTLHVPVVEKTL
jgi:hypothetical protein